MQKRVSTRIVVQDDIEGVLAYIRNAEQDGKTDLWQGTALSALSDEMISQLLVVLSRFKNQGSSLL